MNRLFTNADLLRSRAEFFTAENRSDLQKETRLCEGTARNVQFFTHIVFLVLRRACPTRDRGQQPQKGLRDRAGIVGPPHITPTLARGFALGAGRSTVALFASFESKTRLTYTISLTVL